MTSAATYLTDAPEPTTGTPSGAANGLSGAFASGLNRTLAPKGPGSLGRMGSMEVRLAQNAQEIKAAQRLRYDIFYRELSAIADPSTRASAIDRDGFDEICDHILVVDHEPDADGGPVDQPRIVGTYRVLRQQIADLNDGFYSSRAFNLGPVLARHQALNCMELGRSCVSKPYRTKRTIELLWSGIWSYVRSNGIDVLFGCASLQGTDPDRLSQALSLLHYSAKAPEEWRVDALRGLYVPMNRVLEAELDPRKALKEIPPLVKGYLRLGAYVGDGAVIDHQFGTIDVLIVLPIANINERYIAHFGADGERYAS